MWEQYQKRFIVTQSFILVLVLVMAFFIKSTWPTTLAAFLVMQLGALMGAWSGARLQRKIEAKSQEDPLDRR